MTTYQIPGICFPYLLLGTIHMKPEWHAFWNEFIPSQCIFLYFVSIQDIPRWILVLVRKFVLVSCKLKTNWSGLEQSQIGWFGVSGACYLTWCKNHVNENALGLGLGLISAISQVWPLILHEERLFWGGWVQAHFLEHWLVMELTLGTASLFYQVNAAWTSFWNETHLGMNFTWVQCNQPWPLIWPLLCGYLFKENIVTL